MVNLFQRIKFYCAYYSLWVLLVIPHTTIASDSPAIAPCYQQSGSKQSCLIELPEEAVQKLKIDAGFGWGIFSGTIYNGNENFHVTQLIVSMMPIHDQHHMDIHATLAHEPKVHRIDLDVPTRSKGAISMPLASEDAHIHDFDWKIIKVMGYRMH